MTKKILFVCPYPENVAPSQRLKFEQYYPYFREAGYKIEITSFIDHRFWKVVYKSGFLGSKIFYSLLAYLRRINYLFRLRTYDVVYVHLWVTPFGPPLFERLYRLLSKKMIYDIDDLIYLSNVNSRSNPLVSVIKGRKKPLYLMKVADHVITCTPYLDEFVRKYNQHTTDISSTINTELYTPKNEYSRKEKFVIGWSGSHSTSKYLHLLDNLFKHLAKEHEFKLLVMGDSNFTLEGVEVEALLWKEEYEVNVIRSFDVGVYPLPDEEWVLGKSGLKALQYMALGVPTVATAIGTIHRIIQDGDNGFLVSDAAGWKEKLLLLMNDQATRERMGRRAAITVEERYSMHTNKKTYLRILDGLSQQ
jgi:L-malate glycosyltransferase